MIRKLFKYQIWYVVFSVYFVFMSYYNHSVTFGILTGGYLSMVGHHAWMTYKERKVNAANDV